MMRHPTAQQAREAMAGTLGALFPSAVDIQPSDQVAETAVAATSGGGAERTEDGGAAAGQVNPEALPMLMKIAAILQQAKK